MKILGAVTCIIFLLQQPQTIKVDVGLREVAVSVRNAQGEFVPGLKASDFIVDEDGIPQSIVHFASQDSPTPVSFAVLIDNRTRFPIDNDADRYRAGVEGDNPAFFAAMVGTSDLIARLKPGDEVALMSYSDELKVEQNFTSSAEALEMRLRQMKPSQRRNGLARTFTTLDAMNPALNAMKKAKWPRRVLIVFSAWFNEYQPMDSKESKRIEEQVARAGTAIFGFGIEGEGVPPPGILGSRTGDTKLGQALRLLSSESGGLTRMYGLMTPDQRTIRASEFVRTVLSDQSGQYVIGYYPADSPGAKHVARVRAISPEYRVQFVSAP